MKKSATMFVTAGLIGAFAVAPVGAFEKPPKEPTASSSSSGGTSVPEPAGIALLGLGIGLYIGGAQMRRRRREK